MEKVIKYFYFLFSNEEYCTYLWDQWDWDQNIKIKPFLIKNKRKFFLYLNYDSLKGTLKLEYFDKEKWKE